MYRDIRMDVHNNHNIQRINLVVRGMSEKSKLLNINNKITYIKQ